MIKNKFLQLLGGQVHVQCNIHKLPLIISRHRKKCGCNWQHQHLCCSITTCYICLCKKLFEAYDQKIINFISLTNKNKNSKDDSDNSDDIKEPHDSDDDVTVDGYYFFSKSNQNNYVWSNDSVDFLGIFDSPDVEPDDISEYNSQNSFAIGVIEDKENIEISQLLILPMKIFKL